MNPTLGSKLSVKERTELEKYIKFLVFKMSQVIVQSRFGEKNHSRPSRRSSLHDWFNLAIEDNAEIQAKAKEAISKVQLLKDFCICTEILLKTADGDTLVLETWSLSMNTADFISDTPYVAYTSLASVYCRMTLLLKSIISVTRITPAFKLSTCQSADTYVILFRIYPGEPQKPPFADCDGENDIGAFFRECQSAPPLASFSVQPTLEEQVTDITTQLVKFETSMNEFDSFVDSICHLDVAK
ncbi:unnamed protein product [Larinioides sclopetarius]|uniref:Autophagy-related protein 13 n=2 Tax=Araneidae TaxID=6913 RepID=A0AAV2ATZ3_9ARAC